MALLENSWAGVSEKIRYVRFLINSSRIGLSSPDGAQRWSGGCEEVRVGGLNATNSTWPPSYNCILSIGVGGAWRPRLRGHPPPCLATHCQTRSAALQLPGSGGIFGQGTERMHKKFMNPVNCEMACALHCLRHLASSGAKSFRHPTCMCS